MNLKLGNVKKLIAVGVMLITVSFSGINSAVIKKDFGANSSSLYGRETLSFKDKEGTVQEGQIDRKDGLYAPPPDGGDPIGSETPVEGHETVFFLWAFVGFVLIKLRNKKFRAI